MSLSFTVPDSIPVHPPCPEWCAGNCRPIDSWEGNHHLGNEFVVPLADNEDEPNIALIRLTRLDLDGQEAPTGVWLDIDGQQLFSSLSLPAAEQLATVLLAAVQAARGGEPR